MMIKSKITRRLGAYFFIALTVFALVVAVVFTILFQQQSIDAHRDVVARYASSLARVLSGGTTNSSANGMGMSMGMGSGGYGAYVRFIGEVSNTDIWIVDRNGRLSEGTSAHGMMTGQVNVSAVPAEATNVMANALRGSATSENAKENFLAKPEIIVGAPIASQGSVVGAVIMRSQVDGVNAAVGRSLMLLALSMLIAMMAALLLTVPLSYSFTRPLSKMKDTAVSLADNDYEARAQVVQNDEIGELAHTLDILAQRLDEASRESEQLDQMRRDFIVNISHELRTPVTVMRGSLEALSDGVVSDPEKVKDYHREMLSEAKHLERLVNDLLELSRLQNAQFNIEKETINLKDVVQDAVRSATRLAHNHQVTLDVSLDDLNSFEGDYDRLRQMILTVLDNAIKFTPQGSTVSISAHGHELSVSDEGPGIDEEELPQIFERFYKTRSAENFSGTGLGLAIASEIAQRHDIEIIASNRESGGAKFTFVFPGR